MECLEINFEHQSEFIGAHYPENELVSYFVLSYKNYCVKLRYEITFVYDINNHVDATGVLIYESTRRME